MWAYTHFPESHSYDVYFFCQKVLGNTAFFHAHLSFIELSGWTAVKIVPQNDRGCKSHWAEAFLFEVGHSQHPSQWDQLHTHTHTPAACVKEGGWILGTHMSSLSLKPDPAWSTLDLPSHLPRSSLMTKAVFQHRSGFQMSSISRRTTEESYDKR